MENILENNKLIAEFMGLSYCEKYKFEGWYTNHEHNYRICNFDDLKYHTDWNWLMEVVEKIESLGYLVKIAINVVIIRDKDNENNFIAFQTTKATPKKDAIYFACLDFIKWYNPNK